MQDEPNEQVEMRGDRAVKREKDRQVLPISPYLTYSFTFSAYLVGKSLRLIPASH